MLVFLKQCLVSVLLTVLQFVYNVIHNVYYQLFTITPVENIYQTFDNETCINNMLII